MPTPEEVGNSLRVATDQWMAARRNADGTVNPGLLATAIAVTNHLRSTFPLSASEVATESQIRGQSGAAVQRVLRQFGETRRFLSEAGRTSRGSREAGIELARELSFAGFTAGFDGLDGQGRENAIDLLQGWLVALCGTEYFDRQRLSAELIDPNRPARVAIASIMQAAIERGGNAAGAVAQHLVGAKLSLRFPNENVGRDNYTTADQQTARAGDFQIGDTAFHVTMSPSEDLFRNRCVANIRDGFRPVVVVPEARVAGAAQLADLAGLDDRVEVLSIESFVGLNVEEMASFRTSIVRGGLRALLNTYNERIRQIETNPSLQVDIPANL